jgi:hypothetical protein
MRLPRGFHSPPPRQRSSTSVFPCQLPIELRANLARLPAFGKQDGKENFALCGFFAVKLPFKL